MIRPTTLAPPAGRRGGRLTNSTARDRHPAAAASPAGPPPGARQGRRLAEASTDQRGNYAVFIAVIVTALLFMGGLAYDGPRLIAARQDAAYAANEAARVAAATIASGGTLQQAQDAAQSRVEQTGLIYGQDINVIGLDCVGSRVQAYVASRYIYRSAMRLVRGSQLLAAAGAAEAQLVLPDGRPSPLHHLGECPLT